MLAPKIVMRFIFKDLDLKIQEPNDPMKSNFEYKQILSVGDKDGLGAPNSERDTFSKKNCVSASRV